MNLVPIKFLPRSSNFFSTLNSNLETIDSNPHYYPRVWGRLGNISHLDCFNDLNITSAKATLPSMLIRSHEPKVIPKYTVSNLISIQNDATKEDSLYMSLDKLANMSRPYPIDSSHTIGNVSSFPKFIPIMKFVLNPKTTLNQNQHHHIIEINNHDLNVPLLSSKEEVVSENVVIRFVKKLFYALHFGTMKVYSFWYNKGFAGSL